MTRSGLMAWLVNPDNPSVRYLALTRLMDLPEGDPESARARSAIAGWGPARDILAAQWQEGFWIQPGVGYSPKYKATVWQVIFLAALGAPCTDPIHRACTYLLDHSRLADGLFSAYKTSGGAILCLNGNLVRAMRQLGCRDPRLEDSLEALASMVLRDEFCCRFNAVPPLPAQMRAGLPCAWGAIKALGALAEFQVGQRSPQVEAAIEAAVAFLLRHDLAHGGYPTATTPSPLWHGFGFPLGFSSDLLEALDVLGRLGMASNPQVAAAVQIVLSKRLDSGCWAMEYTHSNMWARFGQLGRPNKWVTLRALCALKASGIAATGSLDLEEMT